MQLSNEQKRAYRHKLMRTHRLVSRTLTEFQTPELFNTPENSSLNRDRAVGFLPVIQRAWPDLNTFLQAPRASRGIHSVWHNGLPVDFQVTRNRADVLLVVFHGALQLNAALPIFPGANVARGLGVARLAFTDPSLYLSPQLPLAWHAGNMHQSDLQQVYTRIINKVKRSIGAKRVILFGSSGGGFASLVQAAAIPGATALIANAQTDALLYHQDHVQTYIDLAWEGDRNAFVAAGSHSAIEKIREAKRVPRVLYMQNSTDAFHIKGHLNPFVREFGQDPEMRLLFGDWGEGHIAPPKELFHASLKAVVDDDPLALDRLGFIPASSYTPA